MPAARASTSSSRSTSTAKKASAKKAPAKKTPAKKTGSKSTAKKASAKKASAKNAPAKKTPAKKTGSKSTAKKASAKKAPAKKTPAKKTGAKSTAKKAPAKKAPAKRRLPRFLTDKAWLKQQREALVRERKSYTHSADSLAAEAAALMADREPGDVQFDEESGEGDTLAVERDRDLALSAKAREKVDEIDAALARLGAGTYGLCIAGDDVIPKERLEALPMAAKCVTHQTAMF